MAEFVALHPFERMSGDHMSLQAADTPLNLHFLDTWLQAYILAVAETDTDSP